MAPPPKVTIIGAGSGVFARQLITDILHIEDLDSGTFSLVDPDPVRLDLTRQIAERLVEKSGKAWHIGASTERHDLLAGTDFLINTIEGGGLANVCAFTQSFAVHRYHSFAENHHFFTES